MPIDDADIEQAASNPKRVESKDRVIEQHSPLDLAKAQQLASGASSTAAAKSKFGLRLTKLVPPEAG